MFVLLRYMRNRARPHWWLVKLLMSEDVEKTYRVLTSTKVKFAQVAVLALHQQPLETPTRFCLYSHLLAPLCADKTQKANTHELFLIRHPQQTQKTLAFELGRHEKYFCATFANFGSKWVCVGGPSWHAVFVPTVALRVFSKAHKF